MKPKRKKRFKTLKNKHLFINSGIMVLGVVVLFFTLNHSAFFGAYQYDVGDTVSENIYLQQDVVDEEETQRLKDASAADVDPIMYIDFSVQVEAKKALTDFFNHMLEIKANYSDDVELLKTVYSAVERNNIYQFTEDELKTLVTLSEEQINRLSTYAIDVTTENMTSGLTEDEIPTAMARIKTYIESQSDINDTEKTLVIKLIETTLTPNKFVDEAKTEAKIQEAISKIEDVTYTEGTLIASKGDTLSEQQYALMQSAGMLIESPRDALRIISGLLLLILIIWTLLHLFLYIFEKKILISIKYYAILMSLFLFMFLISKLFSTFSLYVIPVAAFAMLAGVLFSPKIVLYFGSALVIFVSVWLNLSVTMVLMYWLDILLCALLIRHIRQRSQLVSAGLYVALLQMLFSLSVGFIYTSQADAVPEAMIFSLANGFISVVMTIGILPFFESFFNVLTPFKLLELSNPNRPLLKRLLIEAPGTYHHSILVGNLAEAGAHEIGANGLLTRTASFYHDIGKLERPYYFKENQVGHENPHDKLPPQVSAGIIRNHMSYGLELAKKHKLPDEVIDTMIAHHGTSLIKYFYHMEEKDNPHVDVSKFVYGGPKPESKEAVVLMLADSVEAAVRTLDEPTQAAVSDLIDRIFDQKIAERQLTNADITLRELEKIKEAFLKILSGIFHERIVYPEVDARQIDKQAFMENKEQPEGEKK